jgi:hypothetical protein
MRPPIVAAFFTAAAFLAATAEAADKGIYLGGAIGQSTAEVDTAGGLFDDQDDAFKLVGGLRPLDRFGVEASYVDLGAVEQTQNMPDFSDFRFEQKAVGAFGVFFFDVAMFDLFAKAGLVQWDLEGSGSTLFGPVEMNDDGTDFAWGFGAQVRLRSLAIRLEYERFELETFGGALEKPKMVSLGLTWTFL